MLLSEFLKEHKKVEELQATIAGIGERTGSANSESERTNAGAQTYTAIDRRQPITD
jgi:hypothetical protein